MKTPIDLWMDKVEWNETSAEPNSEGQPYATHSGILEIAGNTLRVYRLNTGENIINAEDINKFFGWQEELWMH